MFWWSNPLVYPSEQTKQQVSTFDTLNDRRIEKDRVRSHDCANVLHGTLLEDVVPAVVLNEDGRQKCNII